MYSKTKINKKLTKATYGYYPSDLSSGSHKKIVVTCLNCNRNIHREFRNFQAKHRCPSVEGSKKRCFKCKSWKDLSMFNKNPKGSGGVAKMCRKCYNNHESVIKAEKNRKQRVKVSFENDFESYVKNRIYKLKHQCKKNNIFFNLDYQYMIDLFNKQKALCYYSNIPMDNKYKQKGFQSWDIPSIDRIDPKKGYIKSNVVWCCFGVNSFKQSLSLEDFKFLIKSANWWFNK